MVSKIVKRLATQLMANEKMPPGVAYAVATKKMQESGNIKKGSSKETTKGKERGEMTPQERAKDRSSKKSGGSPSDYKYNKNNNTAVKGSINKDVKKRK
jgi:hypothetical protein